MDRVKIVVCFWGEIFPDFVRTVKVLESAENQCELLGVGLNITIVINFNPATKCVS